MANCLKPCVVAIKRHLQEDDKGDEFMKTAYVSTDSVESGFGKLDQLNDQSQRVDIWKNFGQTLCSSSGLFLTCRERLRRETNRREQAHEPPLTKSESKLFLLKQPLLGCDDLGHDEELHVFRQCRQNTRSYFANIRLKKAQQIEADLKRKEAHVADAEAAQSGALKRFVDKKNYKVYTSVADLKKELSQKHASGQPKYTVPMQVDIVVAQLHFRRDCLMRTLRPGTLCSNVKNSHKKLDSLLESFKQVCEDECLYPSLMSPPEIRRVYTSHPFANEARKALDLDRNEVTREMTRHFLETYEGGVFLGWRCTVDYTRGHPCNPDALIGQTVSKMFDSIQHRGIIVSFKKWWQVIYVCYYILEV